MKNQPHHAFYVALGRRVKKHREARKMTQENLAQLIGLGRTSVTNIEKGDQQILAHQAIMIAQALNVDLDSLINVPDPTSSNETLRLVPAGANEQEKAWVINVLGAKG